MRGTRALDAGALPDTIYIQMTFAYGLRKFLTRRIFT